MYILNKIVKASTRAEPRKIVQKHAKTARFFPEIALPEGVFYSLTGRSAMWPIFSCLVRT